MHSSAWCISIGFRRPVKQGQVRYRMRLDDRNSHGFVDLAEPCCAASCGSEWCRTKPIASPRWPSSVSAWALFARSILDTASYA